MPKKTKMPVHKMPGTGHMMKDDEMPKGMPMMKKEAYKKKGKK